MRTYTKCVSTVRFLLRQSWRLLATGAGSLALLIALLAVVTSKPASGFGIPSNHATTTLDRPPLTFFDLAQATNPSPPFYPVQLAVLPTLPATNNPITIHASGSWHDGCVPKYQTHQITGNLITIAAVANPPMVVCGPVVTPWSFAVPIGLLPAGSYQVDLAITLDGNEVRHNGSAFTVVAAPVAKLITAVGGEVTQQDRGQRTTLTIPPGALRAPSSLPSVTSPFQPRLHPCNQWVIRLPSWLCRRLSPCLSP